MREKMQRFDVYMKAKGLNDNKVTEQCNLSQGLLGQARTGKSDLGPKTIDKILRTYQDLNKIWLMTGEGEMIKVLDSSNNITVGHDANNINSNVAITKLIDEMAAQREVYDQHINRLLNIIEERLP